VLRTPLLNPFAKVRDTQILDGFDGGIDVVRNVQITAVEAVTDKYDLIGRRFSRMIV
jgi:hypothetical protein